jgi:chemotaxis protein CheZ
VDTIRPIPSVTAQGQDNGQDPDAVADLTSSLTSLQSQIATMETFIKRRFDEISMEINATSQQIDMSEEGMAKRFGEIIGVLGSISYSGDGTTPANTGVELEAVVAETNKAANAILDNADKMNDVLFSNDPTLWSDHDKREGALNHLRQCVQDIIISCSFQDITGQRIKKTLESLNDIEERLSSTLETMGIGPQTLQVAASKTSDPNLKSGSSQADIDALFD